MNQSCRCGRVSWPCLNLLLLSTLAIQGHLHVNRPLDWWGHAILQPWGARVRFLEVVVVLAIKEFEQRCPKLKKETKD